MLRSCAKGEYAMQRHSVAAEIFGYLVCLLAVMIFFMSVAGTVSSAFRIAHPTVAHRSFGGHPWLGERAPLATQPQDIGQPQEGSPGTMGDRMLSGARFDAIRRFVVALVMLVLSILVFRRAFAWLNPAGAAT